MIFLLFIPFFLCGSEYQVKIIEDEGDLPEKFSKIWKKGDYLISDGKILALIGGSPRMIKSLSNYSAADALGCLISFVPAGKKLKSDMIIGSPYIRIKNKRKFVSYSSVKSLKERTPESSLLLRATAQYQGKEGTKAQIQTTYSFAPDSGRIDVSSTIKNTGKVDFKELDYSLYFNAKHYYSFSPFHKKEHPNLRFNVYPKKSHFLGWMNLNPFKEDKDDYKPGSLRPGESHTVNYILLVHTKALKILENIYEILDVITERATVQFKDFKGSLMEVIIRDAISSTVFFRLYVENPSSIEIPLPVGVYSVRANFFPAVKEKLLRVSPKKENICTLYDSPKGLIKLKILNSKGEHVPGKVTFIGLDPTKSPYFKPSDPIKSGRGWESFKNSCYPPEEGLEIEVPVGTYLIYASRGPEYTLDQKVVEIFAEIFKYELRELVFKIDKVVDTENLISIDPHMHTINSDGDVKISERIKALVAEGVEVAIATDHNYITNYSPTLKKLGLDKYLTTINGNEVTVPGQIHYNTYPLVCREDEENNGAIGVFSTETNFWKETTFLFQTSRQKDPGSLIQVNHPRSGTIGYFNTYQLDQESASFAQKEFDTSFDVLEVMNGPYFYSSNYYVIKDWFHLLNRGYFFPGLGSSDSHSINRDEPGYSRTYAYYSGPEGEKLNERTLFQTLKKGRSFTSNGPILEFKVNGNHISGDFFTAPRGNVNIWMEVRSAPWISVDEVRLIINGERKIVFPIQTHEDSIVKFSDDISLNLKKDSYIALEALGKKSLYPVLQARSRTGLLENATLPYALTNPVFVDVDGNGKFDPPLAEKIQLMDLSESKNIIQRY